MIKCWKSALFIALIALPALAAEPKENVAANISMIGPALRSSDLDRSTKFYTTGLGMVVARTLKLGTLTEVIFSFGSPSPGQPVILFYKDDAPKKSPLIEHGNGFGRIMLRVPDVAALAAHLVAAGYPVGQVHDNSANHVKVLMLEDPDGYKYEITENTAGKH